MDCTISWSDLKIKATCTFIVIYQLRYLLCFCLSSLFIHDWLNRINNFLNIEYYDTLKQCRSAMISQCPHMAVCDRWKLILSVFTKSPSDFLYTRTSGDMGQIWIFLFQIGLNAWGSILSSYKLSLALISLKKYLWLLYSCWFILPQANALFIRYHKNKLI